MAMAPGLVAAVSEGAGETLARLFEPRRVRRGKVLYRPDAPAEEVFWLELGWVRLYRLDEEGEEVTIGVVGPGELFGEAALLPGREYGHYAEVMVPGALYAAAGWKLMKMAERSPEVGELLARLLAERLWRAQKRLLDRRYRAVEERLAALLLTLAREGEEGLEVRLFQKDLALLVGAGRETVSRLLARLAERGLLELGYGKVVLKDPAGLEERCAG